MSRILVGVLAALAVAGVSSSAAYATTSGDAALARFEAAWAKVNTYACTIVGHEVSGSHVQDRTYTIKFRKPYDTRMDITAGDGRGGAAVWHGGDTVRGHQGGFISFIRLNLSIHDPKATSLRGTTIAEANFGALLEHLKALKGSTIDATTEDGQTKINIAVADPANDQNVTRELMVLGANGLPVEFDQWEGDTQVKRVTYSDVALNVELSDSTFNL